MEVGCFVGRNGTCWISHRGGGMGGGIYTSTDSGIRLDRRLAHRSAIGYPSASSADGTETCGVAVDDGLLDDAAPLTQSSAPVPGRICRLLGGWNPPRRTAMNNGGICISTNGGTTWVETGALKRNVVFDCLSGGWKQPGGGGELWQRRNRGGIWTRKLFPCRRRVPRLTQRREHDSVRSF